MALLSRVAESLFWLGRYVERAENTARLLDVTYHGRLEPFHVEVAGATNTWSALVSTLGLTAEYEAEHGEVNEAGVIRFLTEDRGAPSSIVSALASARENARSVRDFLSSEAWVAINRLYHSAAQRNYHLIMADGLYDFCDLVRQGAQLFHGTAESTSLHDEGWHWLQTGVFLERADMVTRIVDSKYHLLLESPSEVGEPFDNYQWSALLRSLSGFEAYRRTHVGGINAPSVIEFLLLDARFPRSLRACIDGLYASLDQATDGAEPRHRNKPLRLVTDMRNRLQYETEDSLIESGLHQFAIYTQSQLGEVTAGLAGAFFWSASAA